MHLCPPITGWKQRVGCFGDLLDFTTLTPSLCWNNEHSALLCNQSWNYALDPGACQGLWCCNSGPCSSSLCFPAAAQPGQRVMRAHLWRCTSLGLGLFLVLHLCCGQNEPQEEISKHRAHKCLRLELNEPIPDYQRRAEGASLELYW